MPSDTIPPEEFLSRQRVIVQPASWIILCCACGRHAYPRVGKSGATWQFDGDLELPTFTPSMNESWGPAPPATRVSRCHFTVTRGRIQYHADCTHALAGQTLELECFRLADVKLAATMV